MSAACPALDSNGLTAPSSMPTARSASRPGSPRFGAAPRACGLSEAVRRSADGTAGSEFSTSSADAPSPPIGATYANALCASERHVPRWPTHRPIRVPGPRSELGTTSPSPSAGPEISRPSQTVRRPTSSGSSTNSNRLPQRTGGDRFTSSPRPHPPRSGNGGVPSMGAFRH